MKKASSLLLKALSLVVLGLSFSFSNMKGGDYVEIYAGGKQLLQQFFHVDKSVKTLQLNQVAPNDRIEVFYSHCGATGKNRVLTLKDDQNRVVKEYRYADVAKGKDAMSFQLRDVKKNGPVSLKLYYSSKEMPDEKLLALLSVKNESVAKK